jgi:hypothetical protein
MSKIVNRRPKNSRKKWAKISAKFNNGEIRDLAQFTHIGDAHLYLQQLQNGNAQTIEEIYID